MKLEIKKYLFDIKTSIDSINDFLEGVSTLEKFQKNKLVRRAIEREIEIIGEATNRILKKNPDFKIKIHERLLIHAIGLSIIMTM